MLPPSLKYSQNRLQKHSSIQNRHGKEKQLQPEIVILAVQNFIKILKILKIHWGSIFFLLYFFSFTGSGRNQNIVWSPRSSAPTFAADSILFLRVSDQQRHKPSPASDYDNTLIKLCKMLKRMCKTLVLPFEKGQSFLSHQETTA